MPSRAVLAIAALGLVTACGAESSTPAPAARAASPAAEVPAAPAATAAVPKQPRGYVSRSTLGEAWPLTVEAGVVDCRNEFERIITVDGKTYAVNGIAEGQGYPEIDPIWADRTDVPGLKKDLAPLLVAAGELC